MKQNRHISQFLFATLFVVITAVLFVFSRRPVPPAPQTQTPPSAPNTFQPAPAPAPPMLAAQPATNAVANRRALLPRLDVLWAAPVSEPVFAAFKDWSRRYSTTGAADAAAKAALEVEGVELARSRRAALAALIQSDPKRALELAVPLGVRRALPAAVAALLEERVSARGDLMVVAVLPLPGQERNVKPLSRMANIDGKTYDAFPYDWWLEESSLHKVPMNGIAVGSLFAVNASLARLLEPEEIAEVKPRFAEAICSVSGQLATVNQQETFLDVGGEIKVACSPLHGEEINGQLVAEAGGSGPPVTGGDPLTGVDGYTEGRKRFLIMRPGFSDVTNTMSNAEVPGHFLIFSNFMYEMSYGKLSFAGLGQGSDATPIMKLPGNAADYDGTGLGKLYNTCKDVATTNHGYNLSQFDFLYVVTGSQPAASYAGLGFVRGVGFHLANGYYGSGTSAHEFGHNLGLNHANFWDTDARSVIGAGTSIEYGDGNDTMGGGGGSPQHNNSRYKNYLKWIADGDIATISSANSGTFRVYAQDQADVPGSLRGLRIVRSGSQNYWVQFRQRYTSKAMANGVQLLWTGNGNQSSLLLDTRLKDGSSDNALTIGRTFSDTTLGAHITPIGKGRTYPESMDVVVNVGAFAGNQPPVAVVSAGSASAGAGQAITFSAAATDPNGDPLAYAWDFGDGDYSVDNNASTTHSFASAGEYTVQCAVSDMKGGVARDSVVVIIGGAGGFRIGGRVLNAASQPQAGVKVSVNAARYAVTDSDGTYTISGLAAGSYTVDAQESVAASLSFAHPFFANPVIIGPTVTNVDFVVGTAPPPISLVAAGAAWKYLDDGSNQGTGWVTNGFNDAGWSNGVAQLGYGESDEATVISYGTNASAKYTTYYFRHAFNVTSPATLTNLVVSLLRDDGGIVYLNGVEIFRNNMPAGAVTHTTFASASIDDQVFFSTNVPPALLVAGNNVIAVEIHQADPGSSDVSFDLRLTADATTNVFNASLVYLASPEHNAVFAPPTNLTLVASAFTTQAAFTNVEFFDGAVKLGEDAAAPFTLALNNPSSGQHILKAVARNSGGVRFTSAPVTITISVPAPASLPALTLMPTGAVWRYLSQSVAAPANWATAAFNDASWSNGAAKLGFGQDALTVINGGPAAARYPTVYFRRTLTVEDPGAITNLTLFLKRDDGAVIYFNGVEVLRDNLTNGPVTYSTLAAPASDNGLTLFSFSLNPASLAVGSNIVAVEVHQSSATSSDLGFDLGLEALVSVTNRPRGILLASPAEGASVSLPGSATLAAHVVAGGTLGVSVVEFFSDGVKVGEDATGPYVFNWNEPPSGAHQITAVATDTAGGSITSAPVNITVAAPPLLTELVSSGEVWKYLDDGSDQKTAWRARIFNDTDWNTGTARLGYGGDGEVTTVSYGADANVKPAATYFRHAFNVANPAAFSGLRLRLKRDDGAAVYLNGAEVFRSNLAAGLISYNSLALATVNAPEETTFIEATLSPGALLAGNNVIAVEVHQVTVNSSDLGFDLELLGLTATNLAQGVYLTSPGHGADLGMPASIALAAFAVAPGGVSKVEFFAGATKLGEDTAAPFNFTWSNPPVGAHALTAVATDNGAQTMTSPAVNITVGPVPLPTVSVLTRLAPLGTGWKYLDNGSNQGEGWTGREFNDSGWRNGTARFGHGLDGEFTKLTNNVTTHYFRKWFTVTNAAVFTEMLFGLQRDDGAIIHLNGQEIYRSNMPTGAVNFATLAASTSDSLNENHVFDTFIPTPGSGLVLGSNLLGVELHQSSASSSDAGFDLELWGVGSTEPRVYLATPADGAVCSAYDPVLIEANAWAGAGRSIVKVEFFDGTNKLGEATSAPFSFAWYDAPSGQRAIRAVAMDDAGRVLASEVATITVTVPTVSAPLIFAGSVWKFLDNGSNQGTNFAQPAYNDTAWASGPAELGYSNSPVTMVSFGPNAGAKYITTYFRQWFAAPTGVVITNLEFRLKRDDGAVVWLNGRELYRSNMPPTGAISYTTPASASVGGADESTFFPTSLRVTNALAATNVLAVEVHQNAGDSSDLSFDLELTGVGYQVQGLPPEPAITRAGNAVTISWAASPAGWNLYSSPTVNPGATWTLVNGPVSVVNGLKSVGQTATNAVEFYRLRRP